MRSRPAPGRRPPLGILLLAGAATAVALFAIVSIKVLLGQSTLSSGDIEGRIQTKLQRAEQLQVEVARAESPAEITRRATELGMIHPDGIVPVRQAPPDGTTTGSRTRSPGSPRARPSSTGSR